MKKLLAILSVMLMALSLCACGKSEKTDFVVPEKYATVLQVTINPQFRLYLDADGRVLAIEPVNDDAKEIAKNISVGDGDCETVVHDILTAANEGGFVKENATVNLEVVEDTTQDGSKTALLTVAEKAITDTAKELQVEVHVEKKTAETTVSSAAETTAATTAATTTAATVKTTVATTTKAVCGTAMPHDYKSGVCARCGAKDPQYVSLAALMAKKGSYNTKFVYDNELYNWNLHFGEETGVAADIGAVLSSLPENIQKDESIKKDCETYNGVTYYYGKGDFVPLEAQVNGDTLVLTSNSASLTFVTENGKLKCTAVSGHIWACDGLKVGTVLTYVEPAQ